MVKRTAAGVFSPTPPPRLLYPAEMIVRALEPLTLPKRAARIERAVAERVSSVVVCVESLTDPHNAAAILRTSDGLGIHEVHAIETETDVLLTTRITKGCEKWMDLRRHATPEACAHEMRARGYALYAADMDGTVSLDEVARVPKVMLVFGNEHLGVSEEMRALADGTFAVPMHGMVESFNVSVAAAIAMFAVRQGRHGDLAAEQVLEMRARFLMESIREPVLVLERYARDHGVSRQA